MACNCGSTKTVSISKCDCSKKVLDNTQFPTKEEVLKLIENFNSPEDLALFLTNLEFNELQTVSKTIFGALIELKATLDTKLDKNATNEYISSKDLNEIQTMFSFITTLKV